MTVNRLSNVKKQHAMSWSLETELRALLIVYIFRKSSKLIQEIIFKIQRFRTMLALEVSESC
jgi:hypothetical protein